MKDFFNYGRLLRKMNSTYIILVPKSLDPNCMMDFRPIILCNSIYKIISKVLMNRINPLLSKFINPSQKGSVSSRQILDAAIATCEIIHFMDIRRTSGMAFKLDISKAY